jgi:hypothetical protein
VAKSTIVPGKKRMISAMRAPTRTSRCGSPSFGLVTWYEVLGPPNTVAHPLKTTTLHTKMIAFVNNDFILIVDDITSQT